MQQFVWELQTDLLGFLFKSDESALKIAAQKETNPRPATFSDLSTRPHNIVDFLQGQFACLYQRIHVEFSRNGFHAGR